VIKLDRNKLDRNKLDRKKLDRNDEVPAARSLSGRRMPDYRLLIRKTV